MNKYVSEYSDDKVKGVGRRVLEARTNKGISQLELAKRCGYSTRSAVSKIETGDRAFPINKIPVIAEALGVSVDWLLWGKEPHIVEPSLEGKKAVLVEYIKQMSEAEVDRLIRFLELLNEK